MFGFGKPGRAGLRAAFLVGAIVAAFGVGGVNVGTASAACGAGITTNIHGEGASLQKVAQEIWTGQNGSTGFRALCEAEGGTAEVTYEPSGSGAGLHAWGADDAATFKTGDHFVSTDDAPNAGQIANVNTSLNNATGKAGDIVVVPVAQTAIAIPILPPTGCTLSGDKITNHELLSIWTGTLIDWDELHFAEGECNKPIVRVVRSDGSGTTYQFKNYLNLIAEGALVPCTPEATMTWKALQTNDTTKGENNPNLLWPEEKFCATPEEKAAISKSALVKAKGGSGVVAAVNAASMATEGRIGYAALADAMNGGSLVAQLQNNGLGVDPLEEGNEATFASPVDPELPESSNCVEVNYSNLPVGTINQDWSEVYGANDSVEQEKYPLCTLTFALAAVEESEIFSPGVKATVEQYLLHIISQGQAEVAMSWYSPLPAAVATKAKEAIEKIK